MIVLAMLLLHCFAIAVMKVRDMFSETVMLKYLITLGQWMLLC